MDQKLKIILLRQLYKKSFYEFVKSFWQDADPKPFVDGKLVQYYCEVFQYMCKPWIGYNNIDIVLPEAVNDTDEIVDIRSSKKNININVPPRHSKSMIFNVLGPLWLWIYYPIAAASISHNKKLALKMNSKRWSIVNSEHFKEIYYDKILDTNSTEVIKDNKGGELYSQCRDAMTGFGADLLINDDLTNAETARRDMEEMKAAWSYFQNTMPSRINDPEHSIIINIQQRLAPNDITGHIMSEPDLMNEYIFLTIPSEFDHDCYYICPISGDILVFKKGDTLWPERFGDYKALRVQVGESNYQTQYLQKAVSSDRTVIKEDMIIEKDITDVPSIEQADMVYGSHDFPVKDKESSDFLGSVLAYKVGATLYITDCLEKKMAFVKSVQYVKNLDNAYPGIIQIIEDKANGSAVIQQLQDEVPGIQAFQPGTQSKTQRLESSSIYMPNIVFVRNVFDNVSKTYRLSESLNNLKQRLLAFPFVEHDDVVDGFSMLVLFVFMDRKYMVYGKAFNDQNIIDSSKFRDITYSTVFFSKEANIWKACEIAIDYSNDNKLIVRKETQFKATVDEGISYLKQFAPDKSVFIDCSATEALYGMYRSNMSIEHYDIEDFDKSVAQLNLMFSNNTMLLDNSCKLLKADIENFKYNKSKDENDLRYKSQKDGFVSCLRVAMVYYGCTQS